MQSGAIDEKMGLKGALICFNRNFVRALNNAFDTSPNLNSTALLFDQFGIFQRDGSVIDDACSGHFDPGQTTNVRLDFLYLFSRKPGYVEAIVEAALK